MWLLLLACATGPHGVEVRGPGIGSPLPLLQPSFLDDADPYRLNSTVGHTHLSGGFVTEVATSGQFNRSPKVEVGDQEQYRAYSRRWLDSISGVDGEPSLGGCSLRRDERRTPHPLDGQDDVSLPRLENRPAPSPFQPKAVITPCVVRYETHSGGWYYGQRFGSTAGARLTLMFTAYDAAGEIEGWVEIDSWHRSKRHYELNGPELQQHLLAAEQQAMRAICARTHLCK